MFRKTISLVCGVTGACLLVYVGLSNWHVSNLMEQGLQHDGRFFAESFYLISSGMTLGLVGLFANSNR